MPLSLSSLSCGFLAPYLGIVAIATHLPKTLAFDFRRHRRLSLTSEQFG